MFLTVVSIIFVMTATAFATRYLYKSEIAAIEASHKAKLERKIRSAQFSAWEEGYLTANLNRDLDQKMPNPFAK